MIGRLLTDDERWALIEYLKSIPTEDAQVVRFLAGDTHVISRIGGDQFASLTKAVATSCDQLDIIT